MIPRGGTWPRGCFWLGQPQRSPGNGADGQCAAPFLLVSGISDLELGCRIELVSLAICHPAI